MNKDFSGRIVIGSNSIPKAYIDKDKKKGGRGRPTKKDSGSSTSNTPNEEKGVPEEKHIEQRPFYHVSSEADAKSVVYKAHLNDGIFVFYKSDLGNVKIDCENADGFFASYKKKIGKVGILDITQCKSVKNLFRDCQELEIVEKVIVSPKTDCTNMFAGCKNLRIISFEVRTDDQWGAQTSNFSANDRFNFFLDFAVGKARFLNIPQSARRYVKTGVANVGRFLVEKMVGINVLGYGELFSKFKIKVNGMLADTFVSGNYRLKDLAPLGAFTLDVHVPYSYNWARDLFMNQSRVYDSDGVLHVVLTGFDVYYREVGDNRELDVNNPLSLRDVVNRYGFVLDRFDKIFVDFDLSDYYFWPKKIKKLKTLGGAFSNTFYANPKIERIEGFDISGIPNDMRVDFSKLFVGCEKLKYIAPIIGLAEYVTATGDIDVISAQSFVGCGKEIANFVHSGEVKDPKTGAMTDLTHYLSQYPIDSATIQVQPEPAPEQTPRQGGYKGSTNKRKVKLNQVKSFSWNPNDVGELIGDIKVYIDNNKTSVGYDLIDLLNQLNIDRTTYRGLIERNPHEFETTAFGDPISLNVGIAPTGLSVSNSNNTLLQSISMQDMLREKMCDEVDNTPPTQFVEISIDGYPNDKKTLEEFILMFENDMLLDVVRQIYDDELTYIDNPFLKVMNDLLLLKKRGCLTENGEVYDAI